MFCVLILFNIFCKCFSLCDSWLGRDWWEWVEYINAHKQYWSQGSRPQDSIPFLLNLFPAFCVTLFYVCSLKLKLKPFVGKSRGVGYFVSEVKLMETDLYKKEHTMKN